MSETKLTHDSTASLNRSKAYADYLGLGGIDSTDELQPRHKDTRGEHMATIKQVVVSEKVDEITTGTKTTNQKITAYLYIFRKGYAYSIRDTTEEVYSSDRFIDTKETEVGGLSGVLTGEKRRSTHYVDLIMDAREMIKQKCGMYADVVEETQFEFIEKNF